MKIKKIVLVWLIGILFFPLYASSFRIIHLNGIINSISASYCVREINKAEKYADGVILVIDTPGGIMDSMREIIKEITASMIPIIGYVPAGGRAASAGAFIMLSCDYSAMAPDSNIGAAHPVSLGGPKLDDTMKEKIENDSIAYIRSLALKHKRNDEKAAEMVKKSLSFTAKDALKANLIDGIANSISELLDSIQGKKILKNNKEIYFTGKTYTKNIEMNILERFIFYISNPNIAYILLTLGILGIIFEFKTPGIGFAGAFGGIFLMLAFFGMNTLPVNVAGILFIALGIGLLFLELHLISGGVLGIASVISFIIGSLILFRGDVPYMNISMLYIILVSLFFSFFVGFIIFFGIKSQKNERVKGLDSVVGMTGYAKSYIPDNCSGIGMVFINGELWKACSNEAINEKDKVVVVMALEHYLLKVKKIK